jgi:heme/copper-type cytochrome/quinol oxidase subunit 2
MTDKIHIPGKNKYQPGMMMLSGHGNRGQLAWIWGVVVALLGLLLIGWLFIILKDVQGNSLHNAAITAGADTAQLSVFEGMLYAFPIAAVLGLGVYVFSLSAQTRGY